MKATFFLTGLLLAIITTTVQSSAQTKPFRPPATPLVACDPYFSVWSFADHPGTDWPRHWTGANQAIVSLVRIDGKAYRLTGNAPQTVPPMSLVSSSVLPTRTIYEFEDGGVHAMLTFTTPTLPYDLNILSRPVTYVSWQITSIDGREHAVSLYFDNSAELVVNSTDQEATWSRLFTADLDVLCMGSREQAVLQRVGDDVRIDWGYFYLVSPKEQHAASVMTDHVSGRESFATTGTLPVSDDLRMPRPVNDHWPVVAFSFNLGNVGAQPVERYVVMAYDDQFSIEYFYRKLRPYWRATGMSLTDLLERSVQDRAALTAQCVRFDEELMKDLIKVGGEKYAQIAALAYRQAFAAHKLVADIDGTPYFFPKENFSNGCIATVDVIYPAAPILLLFNPKLLEASITPVLQYSTMQNRWKFPYAPHDLGTYPKANGQVYGGGELTKEYQMPVEESGNLLILTYALAKVQKDASFAKRYWTSLEKWAAYLKDKGLDPENQICTDDFAGHLAHNANLSLKAILALGSYAKLCAMVGKNDQAKEYWHTAQQFAKQWEPMASDGDHYRLAFDKPGTWSQKYNLVWDKLLGLNLFPKEIAEKEIRFYASKQNQFGLPLDSRKDYTKADWLVWTATLAESRNDFEAMIAPLYDFLNVTPDRVPFTDWYDTKTAKQMAFQARSVIGGVFIKMLDDRDVWEKWRSRARAE